MAQPDSRRVPSDAQLFSARAGQMIEPVLDLTQPVPGSHPDQLPQVDQQGPSTGKIIELHPRIAPMDHTRETWLELPDNWASMGEVVFDLREQSYDPAFAKHAQEIFPEGYEFPLTAIEHRVFDAMGRLMDSEDGVVAQADKSTLAQHLHTDSIDGAIAEIREEGARRRAGYFWPTRHSIGGYELNREIANRIENFVERQRILDSARLQGLVLEQSVLENRGVDMPEEDHAELDSLIAEKVRRERFEAEHRDQARIAGYARGKIH